MLLEPSERLERVLIAILVLILHEAGPVLDALAELVTAIYTNYTS